MKKKLITAIISLALFIITLASINSLVPFDNSANSCISAIQTPLLIQISEIIGAIFEPVNIIILSLLLALILFFKGFRKDSFLFAGVMLVGGVLEYLTKELVRRARPENALIQESLNSFPSGHALMSIIFMGFLIYFFLNNIKSKTYKIILAFIMIIFILIVGASRLLLNIHWFSDVIGGWLLGIAILLGAISFTDRR